MIGQALNLMQLLSQTQCTHHNSLINQVRHPSHDIFKPIHHDWFRHLQSSRAGVIKYHLAHPSPSRLEQLGEILFVLIEETIGPK